MTVVLALATLVGVLAGTVVAGGTVTYAGAVTLAVFLAILTLARRSWPVAVLLLSVAGVVALRTAGLTDVGWVWPVTVAYGSVAASEDRRQGLWWAVAVGLAELAFAASWEWSVEGDSADRVLAGVGGEALWLAAVVAAAAAVRNSRRWRAEVADNARRRERELAREAQRRLVEERLSIAREVHDVVAHTLTVVGVQLRVAAEALADSPDETREALLVAQRVRATAVGDLRSLVGLLRELGQEPVAPGPSSMMDGLEELAATARAQGLGLSLRVSGDPAAVPAPVALAVHRVVGEALTNVVRHARAGQVAVTVTIDDREIEMWVTDDGVGARARASTGHGIAGMRERITALGGAFIAAPGPGGGFEVRARVPLPDSRP